MAKRFDFIDSAKTDTNQIESELKRDGYNYLFLLDVSKSLVRYFQIKFY